MQPAEIVKHILQIEELQQKPPVLLDIGASGQIHPEWEVLAPYSVCLAFDADSRDFDQGSSGGFRKQFMVNAIVSDRKEEETDFYLTSSPHCSSTLEPLQKELEAWAFCDLFKTERKVRLKNIPLSRALEMNSIAYVDWFKTDSQGIDLRLFNELKGDIRERVLIAEFEPGFIDAYRSEDKIPGLLNYMEIGSFWLSDCIVKGSQRIARSTVQKYGLDTSAINLRNSACWAEFCYINTGERISHSRDLWLLVALSIVKKQYGFALDILQSPVLSGNAQLVKLTEAGLLEVLRKKEQTEERGDLLQKIKRRLRG